MKFKELPYPQRAQAALPSFNEALLFKPGELFADAWLEDAAGLGKAYANFVARESFFCNCAQPHGRVQWCRPDTQEHGLMCVNCRGIVTCAAA
jgi:hypothetical protein